MRIIIAGMGAIGFHLAKQLSSEEHDIIAIDVNAHQLEYVDSLSDVLTIHGSSTSLSVLKDARVSSADLVISVTSSEEVNITTSILAKKLGAKYTIARVSNDEYIAKDCAINFSELGVDRVLYPEDQTAFEIYKLVQRTAATDVVEFEDGKLSIIGLRIDPTAPVCGKMLKDIAKEYPSFDYRIVAIQRVTQTIIPSGNDRLQKNDQVFIITTQDGLERAIELTGKSHIGFDNIMILGGGKIGRTVAQMLETDLGIKLIESDKDKSFALADTLKHTLVINGDGRDLDLLAQEGIIDMDAFIAVTDDSESNIICCLMAKHLGVKKVVALVDKVDYIPLAQTIGLDSLINKKLIAANDISRTVRRGKMASVTSLYGVDAEVFEFVTAAKAPITKSQLKDLKHFPNDAILGGIIRNGEAHITVGSTLVQEGDKVIVFAFPGAFDRVQKFFS